MFKKLSYTAACIQVLALLLSACQSSIPASRATSTPSMAFTQTAVSSSTPKPDITVRWTFQTNGAIWGSPAISGSAAYTGSDDGNLYALNLQSGTLKWKFPTGGIIRAQPAVVNGLVYFASDDGYLYAVKENGELSWRTDIGNLTAREVREEIGAGPDPTKYDFMQSSPVVTDYQVFIGSANGNMYALDADTGIIQWTAPTGDKVRATPRLAADVLYVGSWDKSTYAFDPSTGKLLWTTPLGGAVQTTALAADGLVFTASRKASVVALDALTGKQHWEFDYGRNMWVESSPVFQNGILYIGSSGNRYVLGLDPQSGKPVTFYFSTAFHWSTPLVFNDTVFVGGTCYINASDPNANPDAAEAGLHIVRLTNGKFPTNAKEREIVNVGESLDISGHWVGVASSPVAAGGLIYFTSLDGKLYALRVAS